ncbi:MAG: lamin tail domain-containing protein [Kiritimatiellia bacterium]
MLGPYAGKLANSGDSIRLRDAGGVTVDSVTYSSEFPWAMSANALGAQDRFTGLDSAASQYKGRSLQRVSVSAGSSDPANWLASPLSPGPTPGAAQAVTRAVPKPVVVSKSHAQTGDGATLVLASAAVTVRCTFSATTSLSGVQLEWFVDDVNSTTETHTTTAMTDLGGGGYSASIPGQAARSIVRYRFLANRGDGSEVVSPRADDPAIAAVGASNAVQAWHGYFVYPSSGRTSTNPVYDALISTANLATITTNATQTPARVTAASASGLPRSVPWVAASAPQWDGTVPAVFSCNGVLYDVRMRFHGSRYHRSGYATSVAQNSFKIHFPETQPFRGKTSWFITPHAAEFDEATRLNRLIGLPASQTRFVSWYLNSNAVATKLEQGEYNEEMLDDYHRLQHQLDPAGLVETTGELYKNVGNRDASQSSLEGPYTCGDLAPLIANANWTQLQRYEWTFSLQNNAWKGPRPMREMHEGMWTARGDTPATHNFSSDSTKLASAKAWFNTNYDMDATLTSMALLEWMSIWDDGKQNHFFWRRASGKWSRLGWDYDGVMSSSGGGGPGGGGSYTQTIYGGEYGATTVFDGVNWWKDTFYKCFRTEYKQRLWEINNSFCDPANLLAMGFATTSKPYTFALVRQAQVNTQLALGTYTKPARPSNSSPSAGGTILAGASLTTSAYSHPSAKTHLSTRWEIRSSDGNYEEPVYRSTSTTALTSLPVPYDFLTYGKTYYWHASHLDADGHASILSAETAFTWGAASTSAGTLVLNEILADNGSTVENAGDWPDYIEIRNNGATAYDLTGVTLTDDVAVPAKFTFPAGNALAAGAHLLVWCDKDAAAPGLHTGFSLGAGGQTVLMMSGATLLDSVTFGPQARDVSIGRIVNGTGSWAANIPSPGLANAARALGTSATLRINEWMAAPAYGDDWFELYNSGADPVALAGLYLSDTPATPAITRIPDLSFIGAGVFTKFDANGSGAGGNDCNFKLSASGDNLVLTAANGTTTLDQVNFSTQTADVSQGRLPDGGVTIAAFATTASPEKPNWLPAPVVVQEALARPDDGGPDWIELANPGAAPVDVGGWWLSDDVVAPQKYQIPAGTVVPAGGTVLFTYAEFGAGTVPFSLSSGGDEVCLAAVDGSARLTGYRSQVSFGASAGGVSFGRVAATGLPNGKGGAEFWPQTSATPSAANASPVTTPVILNEIMYHPVDGAGAVDVTGTEFIELHNPSNAAVDLGGWRLKGDVDFTFASGTVLPAFGYLVVVHFDPVADPASRTSFLAAYGLSAGTPLAGPFTPNLANSTMRIELSRPDATGPAHVQVNVDKAEYRDLAPWPVAADGTGASLQRVSRSLIGNTADNWNSAAPTPGALNSGLYTALAVWSRSPLPDGVVGAAYSFDWVGVGGAPAYAWELESGDLPGGVTLAGGRLDGTPEESGTFHFTVRLTDSLAATTSAAFTLTVPADSDGDGMDDAWERLHALIIGVNDSAGDEDGDLQSNADEFIAGTDPRSDSSVFAILSTEPSASGGVTLTWPGVAGRTYRIWSSPDLTTWTPLDPELPCLTDGVQSTLVPSAIPGPVYLKAAVTH